MNKIFLSVTLACLFMFESAALAKDYVYLGFNAGKFSLKGDDWQSSTENSLGYSFRYMTDVSDRLALGVSVHHSDTKGVHRFERTKSYEGVRLESITDVRPELCLRLLNTSKACLASGPATTVVRGDGEVRSLGLSVASAGWETVFDNGLVLRADANSYWAAEARGGKRSMTMGTSYIGTIGYILAGGEK